VFASGAII